MALEAQDPAIYFAVARDDRGTIAGLTTVRHVDSDTLFMSRLYVHPAHQRRGIGARLLNEAICAFPGAKIVRLEVEGHLEAYLHHLLERKLNSPRFLRQIEVLDGAAEAAPAG